VVAGSPQIHGRRGVEREQVQHERIAGGGIAGRHAAEPRRAVAVQVNVERPARAPLGRQHEMPEAGAGHFLGAQATIGREPEESRGGRPTAANQDDEPEGHERQRATHHRFGITPSARVARS
jgi:hypothetical protein